MELNLHEKVKFMNHVIVDNGCFNWKGAKDTGGYGSIRFRSKLYKAPRVAYYIYHGKWPEFNICHTCDNRECVRKDHLYDGTMKQNMKDKSDRGRWVGRSKLDLEDIQALRQMHNEGVSTYRLMKCSGLSRTAINNVISGRSWKQTS